MQMDWHTDWMILTIKIFLQEKMTESNQPRNVRNRGLLKKLGHKPKDPPHFATKHWQIFEPDKLLESNMICYLRGNRMCNK